MDEVGEAARELPRRGERHSRASAQREPPSPSATAFPSVAPSASGRFAAALDALEAFGFREAPDLSPA